MGGSKTVTIGYKYYLGMHMVICHGPVDSVQAIIAGERTAWSGNITSSQQITISAEDLFGGRKKEGGISGKVDIMMGEATQVANDYLVSQLGTPMPAFRGVLSAVLRRVYICAMSAYPKPWAFKVKRIPGKTWYAAKAEISGSANPVHVIYETLTNTDWGMGYPTTAIDDASFKAAADQCYSESLGVSMIMSNQDSIEKFIYDCLGHLNGMLYAKPTDGKFAIKLLRDDYTVSSLSSYNESNVVSLESFERPSYAEMVNEVVVVYRPQGTTEDDSVTVQDLASIQSQGGIVSQTVQYPGIDNATNAARVAMRDLRQKSTPLSRIRIHVNRNAWNVTLGSVFKFSWAEHGLVDVVYRALSINTGTLQEGVIAIDAVEDVFGLPLTTYMGNQPSAWVDPIVSPTAFSTVRIEEANYFDLATRMSESDLAIVPSSAAYLVAAVGQPSSYCNGAELWSGAGSSSTDYNYASIGHAAPFGTLSANITELQASIVLSTMSSNFEFTTQLVGKYAYIDDEIVRIDAIDLASKTITVGRGCLDTVAVKHNIGSIFICYEFGRIPDSFEYAYPGSRKAKLLMRTPVGLADLAAATEYTKTFTGRFGRPYAPGNFKCGGQSYPTSLNISPPFTISWSHRDKTQQLVRPIIDTTAGNIGPETGVTYSVQLLRASDNSVLDSATGLTGTSYNPIFFGSMDVKAEVWAVKDGLASHQKQSHQFNLTVSPVTVTLLHFNGTNASTTITDSAPTPKTFTAFGDAQLTTTNPKLGTACLKLDGTGDWVQTAGHSDFVLGIYDFTIECFINTTDSNFALIDFYGNYGWQVYITSAGKLSFYAGTSRVIVGTISVNTGSWIHVAVTRQGTALKLWVNGVQDGSVTNSTNMSTRNAYLAIGAQVSDRNPSYDMSGLVDEVRIRRGEALYTANFTPPTVELT